MASVVFLFPGSDAYEALDGWVLTVGRHLLRNEVYLARKARECKSFDAVFVLTENNSYPVERVEEDLRELRGAGVPFAVVHNNDRLVEGKTGGIPPPGDYPSFAWTRRGQYRLERMGHRPVLLRQPVMPPLAEPNESDEILVGTFGHIEPKKHTYQMWAWAKRTGVRFIAFGPNVLAEHYQDYIGGLRRAGCNVHLHPWFNEIEELLPHADDVTHWLFVLPESKGGTGGSPTSPRYAGFFNRPVLVVDDEATFVHDGYYVFNSLDEIREENLPGLIPPSYSWGPDEYVEALVKRTLEYWRK